MAQICFYETFKEIKNEKREWVSQYCVQVPNMFPRENLKS